MAVTKTQHKTSKHWNHHRTFGGYVKVVGRPWWIFWFWKAVVPKKNVFVYTIWILELELFTGFRSLQNSMKSCHGDLCQNEKHLVLDQCNIWMRMNWSFLLCLLRRWCCFSKADPWILDALPGPTVKEVSKNPGIHLHERWPLINLVRQHLFVWCQPFKSAFSCDADWNIPNSNQWTFDAWRVEPVPFSIFRINEASQSINHQTVDILLFLSGCQWAWHSWRCLEILWRQFPMC